MMDHRLLLRRCALAAAAMLIVSCPALAETAAGPAALPGYPDQTSAYRVPAPAAEPVAGAPVAVAPIPAPASVPQTPPMAATVVAPQPVRHASFETTAPAAAAPSSDPRRLAPPTERRPVSLGLRDRPRDAASFGPQLGLPLDSIYTTLTALAVVVGLFLACAWIVRRGQKKSNQNLPESVVSVLGRVPLAARQFAELVRVGNKLVLVSITPHGVEPITEVTDPVEIDRLLGLCQQGHGRSATTEFDQVFRQLADETAPAGFLGAEASQFDLRGATDPFAAYRGGLRA